VTDGIKMLYVFVDIAFDVQHLILTLVKNFSTSSRLALVSTIQFIASLHVRFANLKIWKIAIIHHFSGKRD
jgi:2-(3-amino-3-carboxypropyl)histidine synthase